MRRLPSLPRVFGRYAEIGGVIDFAIFEDANGSPSETVEAIVNALGGKADGEALRRRGARSIDEATFFGAWYDPVDGALVKRGLWRVEDGTITDPKLATLDGTPVEGGAFQLPEIGSGGQFACAYLNPPYGLSARPSEVQAIFSEMRDILLPRGYHPAILDWSSPRLVEVSDYFEAGLEWWGVYLFSIHLPETRRLTIAMASATD